MPKPPPRYLNKAYADVLTKWMSRFNTWAYRRTGGEGLGGPGVVDLADQGGQAAPLGHPVEHRPELRLQGQGGGVARQVDGAFDQHPVKVLAKK